MLQAIEGMIDQEGKLRLFDNVCLPKLRRVIITILDEEPLNDTSYLALVSESVLARDWDNPEEDAAWAHLDQLPSL